MTLKVGHAGSDAQEVLLCVFSEEFYRYQARFAVHGGRPVLSKRYAHH